MDSLETKRLAPIRILQILEKYSDVDHPMTQSDIADKLYELYGIELERKTVSKNLSLLIEAGYDVMTTRRGAYLASRLFEDSELRLLIDGILSSKYVNKAHSEDLIEKLVSLGGIGLKSHTKHVFSIADWDKTDNAEFFFNIELVDEAIEKGQQLKFRYNKYNIEKQMVYRAIHVVSPYQMILHNQRYYLVCFEEKWRAIRFFRMDKITGMRLLDERLTPIRSVEGYEGGIDYKDLTSARPYMYTDRSELVTIRAKSFLIDDLIDWFGKGITIREKENDYIEASFAASPKAMVYWALQYSDVCEVTAPQSLREQVKAKLRDGLATYGEG